MLVLMVLKGTLKTHVFSLTKMTHHGCLNISQTPRALFNSTEPPESIGSRTEWEATPEVDICSLWLSVEGKQ